MYCTGTPVNRIPIMAKRVLDLYELYRLVVSKGGLVEVINKKLWREITKELNLPSSITSAAFTLRTQYVSISYLHLIYLIEFLDTVHLLSLSILLQLRDFNDRITSRKSILEKLCYTVISWLQ
jgi:hypothetical protein